MSIVKSKSGSWKIVVRVRNDGHIVQRREDVQGSKEQAKARVEALKYEIRHGKPPARSLTDYAEQRTFGDMLDIYCEKSPKAPFSANHKRTVDGFKSELGDVPLQEFPDRFEGFLKLKKQTPTIHGKKRGPASLNRYIEIAKAAYEVSLLLGNVTANPITKIRFPQAKETPRDVDITNDDREGLVSAARNNPRVAHIADAMNYAIQVPTRKGEIVGMRVRDIDLFNRVVRIRNGTTKNEQGIYKPIPPDMIEFFKQRVRDALSPDEPVFYRLLKGSRKDRKTKDPKRLPLGDFKKAWDTVRKECKLAHVRVHDTRHVSATALVDAGTPERIVMQVAGWKTNMLATYYNRHPKKALDLVKFGGSCEPVVNQKEGKSG